MENHYKFVNFERYCPECQHKTLKEDDHPCDECLTYPTNVDSHKPVFWKEKSSQK